MMENLMQKNKEKKYLLLVFSALLVSFIQSSSIRIQIGFRENTTNFLMFVYVGTFLYLCMFRNPILFRYLN